MLDWFQTLSRSKTESAERVKRIPKENLELIKRLKAQFQHRIVLKMICSFIASSNKNLDSLVEACNNTEDLRSLISFVVIARSKTGSQGKKAAVESLVQRKAPTILIDGDHEVIEKCEPEFSTIHLKLRRKPAQEGLEWSRDFWKTVVTSSRRIS